MRPRANQARGTLTSNARLPVNLSASRGREETRVSQR